MFSEFIELDVFTGQGERVVKCIICVSREGGLQMGPLDIHPSFTLFNFF